MNKTKFCASWQAALLAAFFVLGPVAGAQTALACPGPGYGVSGRAQPIQARAWRNYGYVAPYRFAPGAAPRVVPSYQSRGSDYLHAATETAVLRWPQHRLPIRVFIAPGAGTPGYRESFRGMMMNAFDEWAAASGGKLAWQLVSSHEQADVVCLWTTKLTGRGPHSEAGRTSTRTRLDARTGRGMIDSVVVRIQTVNGNQPFRDEEMRRVILHEVGHAYGLDGHSPDFNHVMYASIHPRQQPYLTQRDRATIARLYAGYPAFNGLAMGQQTYGRTSAWW